MPASRSVTMPCLRASVAQLVGRGVAHDHVAHVVVHDHQLEQARRGPCSPCCCRRRSPAAIELLAGDRRRASAPDRPASRRGGVISSRHCVQMRRTSRWARIGFDRGRDQKRRHAHVAQPRDRAGRVVGVQRAEHHVAGERGLHGDLGRFQVADLADQDLVGVLPQDGPQAVWRTCCRSTASIGICMMPSMSYSTGSSVVISLSSMLFSSLSAE